MASCSGQRSSDGDFRLQVENWTDSDDNEQPLSAKEPPAKRKRLSLPKKGRDSGSSFLSVVEEAALSEKCVPKNTATSTKWAVANFEGWRKRRNEAFHLQPERQVPDGLLLGLDSAALCKWLAVYVAEAKKQDGSPLTVTLLLIHFHLAFSNLYKLQLLFLMLVIL